MDKEREEAIEVEQSEIENFVPYQNPTLSVEDAVRLFESCPVCSCRVRFTNFSDFARLVSHEVVRCEECGYRAKKDMSNLQ